jgi:hypothetical protein
MRVNFHRHCYVSMPQIGRHSRARPFEHDQHARIRMPQSVHRDSLFNFCLFERRRQSVAAYSGPVARFAKFVTKHELKPVLRTFLFPVLNCAHKVGWNGDLSYPLLGSNQRCFSAFVSPFTRAVDTVRRKSIVARVEIDVTSDRFKSTAI